MQQRPLAGQAALVTGGSSGIGRACAMALAEAGAAVAVNYFGSPDAAREVVRLIEEGGGRACPTQADVSKEAEVQAMFREAVDAFGTLHILVSNAGIQSDSRFADMTLAQWQAVIDVNLTGAFLCAREAVREFRRRGPQPDVSPALGKIVFTSSVHEIIPWAGHVNYAASKGGLMLLMKSLAQELAWEKVRVNGVAPGAIRTAINQPVWSDAEKGRALLRLIPYQRIGEAEDVARAVVWLASDASDYVNGVSLLVDGGMTLYPAFADNG